MAGEGQKNEPWDSMLKYRGVIKEAQQVNATAA